MHQALVTPTSVPPGPPHLRRRLSQVGCVSAEPALESRTRSVMESDGRALALGLIQKHCILGCIGGLLGYFRPSGPQPSTPPGRPRTNGYYCWLGPNRPDQAGPWIRSEGFLDPCHSRGRDSGVLSPLLGSVPVHLHQSEGHATVEGHCVSVPPLGSTGVLVHLPGSRASPAVTRQVNPEMRVTPLSRRGS